MTDMCCPYCDASVDAPDDTYTSDTPHEATCDECQKTFVFYTEYSPTYWPQKADCLNGADHDYQETKTYPKEFTRLQCTGCDHEKPISPERRAQLKAEDEAARHR